MVYVNTLSCMAIIVWAIWYVLFSKYRLRPIDRALAAFACISAFAVAFSGYRDYGAPNPSEVFLNATMAMICLRQVKRRLAV